MKRTTVALAALGAALLSASACSSSGETRTGDDTGGAGGDGVTVAIEADPGSLNPITNATQAGETLAAFSYESLLSFPPGQEETGALAEKWEVSTTEAVFTLKKDITCADGAKLTPSDVAATFTYAQTPDTGSPYRGVYFPAEGLTVTPDDAAGTVTFTVDTPQSFLNRTIGSLPIVCAAGLKDPEALATKTFGTGPYELTEANPGQSYDFALREDYAWGPGGITAQSDGIPRSVVAKVVTSLSTRANMLQSGEVQLASISGIERDRFTEDDFTTSTTLNLRPGLLFFNQAPGRPTNDLAVRQAIATGVDYEGIGNVASEGYGEPMTNLVPGYDTLCPGMDSAAALPSFDVEKAKALLDEAGWKVGKDGLRAKDGKPLLLKVLFPSEESAGLTGAIELLQQKLGEIGVRGEPTPAAAYTDVIFQGGDWDLVWAPIYTTLPSDWQGILSGEFPPDGGNWTYNTNEEYFTLAAQAQGHAGKDSCQAWTKAQDSLITDLEVLPVTSSTTTIYGKGVAFDLSKTILAPATLKLDS